MSAAGPSPFSTTAEPASASAQAIPSPMPLVEPVTSETLPASGRAAATPCVLSWIFMAVLSGGDSAPYADHLRPTLPRLSAFEEMPFGFQNHTLTLSRLWCHRTPLSDTFSAPQTGARPWRCIRFA